MDQSYLVNLPIFKSLFRGREDIFAQRWEKGGKAGYSPQYDYDPYQYRLHKMKGGTIQNYADKQPRALSDEQIAKHLSREQFIGIYPLLKDNTSWFIAADFDKAKWIEECRSFLTFCHDQGLHGQADGVDRRWPILIDPSYTLIVKRLRWSTKIGERWSDGPAFPL